MVTYLIFTGRPGSGKSTLSGAVARRCGSGRPVPRLNDYAILRQMFEEEEKGLSTGPRQFCRREQNNVVGFDIKDRQVLKVALCLLNEYAREYRFSSEYVLLEFARNDYTDIWNYLSMDIRMNAHFFFLQTPFDVCIQRIYKRVETPRGEDDKLISEETMLRNHQNDGLSSLQAVCTPGQMHVIDNGGAWADTWADAQRHLDVILSRPTSTVWSLADLSWMGPFVKKPY